MASDCDVLIVGAGPAGSFLAAGLADAGLQVALVDRARFPRDKVCGGGISQKTLSLLPRPVREACVTPVGDAVLAFRNTGHLEKRLGTAAGGAVLRSRFDAALLDRARDLGAIFFPDAPFASAERRDGRWHCRAGDHEFRSTLLVGADGVFSRVRQRLFPRQLVEYRPAVEAHFHLGPRLVERFRRRLLFDFGGMTRGYGWIFPKHDHLNVGVYSVFACPSIRAEFEAFCRLYPLLGAATRVSRHGHAIPVRNTQGEYERDGCLLVGDAGGFAEALYGEGIYFALKSADCARRGILAQLVRGAAGEYTRLVRAELEPELRYSLRNARLFFTRPALAYALLARNGATVEWFGQLIHGGLTHRQVFRRTVGAVPYWLLFGGRTAPLPDAEWLRQPLPAGVER